MSFIFKSKKVAQAVAYLLSREPTNRTEYMRILKLLYMADRKSLAETRRPITGDDVYSMDFGPVLSRTYDIIKELPTHPDWNELLRKDGYFLELCGHSEFGLLSKYERSTLDEVSQQHRGMDVWKVSDLTHTFPEWTDPKGGRIHTPLRKQLGAVGLAAEANEVMRAQLEATELSERLSEAGK